MSAPGASDALPCFLNSSNANASHLGLRDSQIEQNSPDKMTTTQIRADQIKPKARKASGNNKAVIRPEMPIANPAKAPISGLT
ncbi:hypothetical protein BH11PSE12_BH11PSE12_04420 [soil metagenome]